MHADPELLGLLALGERVGTDDDHLHVQTCAECSSDLSALQQVVTLGRGADLTMATPRQEVWVRIREELGFDPSLELTGAALVDIHPAVVEAEHELMVHAQLRPVQATWSQASGVAELATDELGRRILQVTLLAELPVSGLRQAWLIHRDDPSVRQSLGILDGPHGLWTVDHSIDLDLYPILDISQQGPGEIEHSGQTIVRGEFTLVS